MPRTSNITISDPLDVMEMANAIEALSKSVDDTTVREWAIDAVRVLDQLVDALDNAGFGRPAP